MKIDITKTTEELKNYIGQFDTISFVTQYYYALNTHLRRGYKTLNVKSPHRQIMYLLSLFMDTKPDGKKVFDRITGDAKKIESLLEEIETGYRENYLDSVKNFDIGLNASKKLLVANQTFVNYFVNGELNYTEQEIDRIEKMFMHHQEFIQTETGLQLDDYLLFFEVTDFIDFHKMEQFIEDTTNDEIEQIFAETINKNIKPSSEQFEKLFNIAESALYKLPIHVDLLYKMISKNKIDILLDIFSITRDEDRKLRYYTDESALQKKPIIRLNDEYIILPIQKQLIHAIFNFLFETCLKATKDGKGILRRKDKFLEEKTFEIFHNFFDGNARIFKNYYVEENEKDLIVLYRGVAFIIECKAYDYREPLRDPAKAFQRIRDDFKKGIQTGYNQAWAVKKKFLETKPLEIKDKDGSIIETISTKRYRSCFSIVISNERYGQIQCDLGLLLELKENDVYPWAVYIDDLETFLLTLKRKNSFFGDFTTWLNVRELLHGRLLCFDELELCSYFLMRPKEFANLCRLTDKLFVSSPDMNLLFDNLYQTGLGFMNERNLDKKIIKECLLSKELKLKMPAVIKEYKKNYGKKTY